MSINKEIVVYASLPAKKFRWFTNLAIIQIGFVVVNLFGQTEKSRREGQEALAIKAVKREKNVPDDSKEFQSEQVLNLNHNPATFFERLRTSNYSEIFSFQNIEEHLRSDRIFFSCTGVILICSAVSFIRARRTVHMITLLPGERVRIAFFSAFYTKPPTIELPLQDVSCVSGRQSIFASAKSIRYSVLKLKNYRRYHLVDLEEGKFLEPKLYDKHLGYKRAWAERK